MTRLLTGLGIVLAIMATAAVLETCSSTAHADTSVERWVRDSQSSYEGLRRKMTAICTLSPECKAYAEAQVAAWDAAKAAEREAAMTPSKPRGPIPEQAEFKKRLGEINLMKEK